MCARRSPEARCGGRGSWPAVAHGTGGRHGRPPASRAAGGGGRRQGARCAAPAACSQPAGGRAAQARPRTAAHASGAPCGRCHRPEGARGGGRDRPAAVLRRPERAPVARQPLRVRARTPAPPRRRSEVHAPRGRCRGDAAAAGAGACLHWERPSSGVAYH